MSSFISDKGCRRERVSPISDSEDLAISENGLIPEELIDRSEKCRLTVPIPIRSPTEAYRTTWCYDRQSCEVDGSAKYSIEIHLDRDIILYGEGIVVPCPCTRSHTSTRIIGLEIIKPSRCRLVGDAYIAILSGDLPSSSTIKPSTIITMRDDIDRWRIVWLPESLIPKCNRNRSTRCRHREILCSDWTASSKKIVSTEVLYISTSWSTSESIRWIGCIVQTLIEVS